MSKNVLYRCSGVSRTTGASVAIAVVAGTEDEAIMKGYSHGVLVEVAEPDESGICCQRCFTILDGEVQPAGQVVTCTRCRAHAMMPDRTGQVRSASTGQKILSAVAAILGALGIGQRG